MLRTVSVALCSILLRIFFRRIELVGRENIPSDGLILFVINHPSALIDPLFILCLTGKKVSFLAKEPLFRMPVVSLFVKAFDSLPVYRTQDGADPKKNREMLEAARTLLLGGNALALFPEGTSHSDPQLKPLRSGAARLALSTRAISHVPVYLVPGGLFYEQKQSFRSRALLTLGPAIEVPQVELDEKSEPNREVARAVTAQIQDAIQKVVPTAETLEGLGLSETAERLFSAAIEDAPDSCPAAVQLKVARSTSPSLAERIERRTLFISAYQTLIQSRTDEVNQLVAEILELTRSFAELGKDVDATESPPRWTNPSSIGLRLVVLLLLAPFATLGLVAYAPAYYSVRFIALRYSAGEEDVTATVKLIAGALLFPLSWLLLVGSATANWPSWWTATGVGVLLAVSALSAVWFQDSVGALLHQQQSRKRLTRAPQNWSELRERRASVAEKIAKILIEHGYSSSTDAH